MNNKPTNRVIILNESLIGSIIKDIFTFGMFAGLMYFNHRILSGSTFVDVLFIILVMMFIQGKFSSRAFSGSSKSAIKWLEDRDKQNVRS